ncbi:protein PTST homolog 2, chloroplastic [Tanacetum coccineum]
MSTDDGDFEFASNGRLQRQVHESSASELQQLSDVWEFQENELMKAEAKLRSIRAKLAVFEGKIALSKLVEEKQRRIDSAHRTLQLLRTTCIFWTHSASEVLLAGSFDGWTSQIKMEKTQTGIFSSSLKLYPGRYEARGSKQYPDWCVDPALGLLSIGSGEIRPCRLSLINLTKQLMKAKNASIVSSIGTTPHSPSLSSSPGHLLSTPDSVSWLWGFAIPTAHDMLHCVVLKGRLFFINQSISTYSCKLSEAVIQSEIQMV